MIIMKVKKPYIYFLFVLTQWIMWDNENKQRQKENIF